MEIFQFKIHAGSLLDLCSNFGKEVEQVRQIFKIINF